MAMASDITGQTHDVGGMLVIISGPSGVGKDTVADIIRKRYRFSCPKSYTTRKPRNLPDDSNYIFVTDDEFDNEADDLIAATISHGHRYGISRKELERDLHSGKNIMKVLDMSGADSMKRLYGDSCLTIFLLPPSMDVLRERLSSRGSENRHDFLLRMSDSIREISEFENHMFDKAVTVIDANQAACDISSEIDSYMKRKMQLNTYAMRI